jgi:plastocyanin
MPRRRVALVLSAVAVLAAPAAAEAATKSVSMGQPKAVTREFNERLNIDVNDYFPHTVTIRVGDSVRFLPGGFHTVDLPPRGGRPLTLASPTGQKIAGANDPAGAPFWFNGQDQLGFTRELGTSGFGKRFTFTGARRVQSGLPLERNPKAMTVRFNRAGTFTAYCSVHSGMKGRVRVLRAGRRVPSAAADRRTVARQVAAARAVGRRLAGTTAPAQTVDVGAAGRGGVEYFGFFPRDQQVPVGTTLRFRMSPGTFDVHTATTGPGDPENQPQSFLGLLAASFNQPVFDQSAAYPSDPPTTIHGLSPTSHGNGFWNTGVMDGDARSPLPASGSVRFDAPGTYTFFCLIHPFMKATVVAG